MKRTNIFAALACALLVIVLAGCGTSNNLQSITLTANQAALSGGIYNLVGDGSTIQLKATGEYSSGKTKDLSNMVTWNMIVDPNYTQDAFKVALPPPGQTAQISATGLVTAVEPATCTWIDVAPVGATPSWFFVGAYQVTATFEGVTSQPVYIPIASSGGNTDDIFAVPPIVGNNLSQLCGPS